MNGLVAIVGRPNVGKSTLFNRLVGSKKAIVDDLPGVTRDRHYGAAEWLGRHFTVVDTGGFDPDAQDALQTLMREQAQLAIEEADIILFVVDARAGVTSADAEIANLLRRTRKPVFTLANKTEGKAVTQQAMEVYELGTDRVHLTSGEHGLGIWDLMEEVVPLLPEAPPPEESDRTRIAIVGRPNVGKSSLINKLLGEERLLASDVPGTTRDSIDTTLDWSGDRKYLLIDTAGIRRKRSISLRLEKYSVVQSIRSIARANVAILVLDASTDLADQDAKLLGLMEEAGRSALVAINKWDLVEKDSNTAGGFVKAFRSKLPSCAHLPIVFVSAKSGQRVGRLLDEADKVWQRAHQRIGTGELNRFFRDVVLKQPPPSYRHRLVKFYFATQAAVDPPVIVVTCNYPEALPDSYRRFVINQLRELYDFSGVPLRVVYRKRKGGRREGERLTPLDKRPLDDDLEGLAEEFEWALDPSESTPMEGDEDWLDHGEDADDALDFDEHDLDLNEDTSSAEVSANSTSQEPSESPPSSESEVAKSASPARGRRAYTRKPK